MEIPMIAMGLLFFGGHALQWVFKKTKVPDLLILTIMGYVAGPVMGWITPEDLGKAGAFVSTLALVVILYDAGLNLSRKELKDAWLPSLLISLASFTTIALAVLIICAPVVPFPETILISFAVGSTSSAIVIPMVKFLSVSSKTKTILSLESAFTDIFAIVLFLVALEAIQQGHLDIQSVLYNIGPNTLNSMLFGLFTGLVWAAVKRAAPEYTYMKFAGESWALLTYGVANVIGLNGAMAVLCLGFTFANLNLLPRRALRYISSDPVSFEEMSLLRELTFLLKTFFFLYLGTLITFQDPFLVFIGVLVTMAIFVTRFACVWLLFKPSKYSLLDVLVVTAMGPRGLACAVLATIPLSKGMAGGDAIQQILFAVIPLSIFLTATFVFIDENAKLRRYMGYFFPLHKDGEPEAAEA